MSNENIFINDDENSTSLTARMIAGFEQESERTLYPGDPIRLLLQWEGDLLEQGYALIEIKAKRNLLKYATGLDLDNLAEMFRDQKRIPGSPAFTTLRFNLSEAQTQIVGIPIGARAAAGDVIFVTEKAVYITPGDLFADVQAKCSRHGGVGNNFLPGQINTLVDVFPYLLNVRNTTKSEGGADEESDAAFYDRINKGFESYTNAGSMGAYEYYAMSASTLIKDAKAYSDTPGVVKVKILLSGGEAPGEEMINLVLRALSAEKVRPLTDFVEVAGPDRVSFDINFTYYIPAEHEHNPEIVKTAVEDAVSDYIKWQTEVMGRSINSSELFWRLKAAGIVHAEISEPKYTDVHRYEAASLSGDPQINLGGFKDE